MPQLHHSEKFDPRHEFLPQDSNLYERFGGEGIESVTGSKEQVIAGISEIARQLAVRAGDSRFIPEIIGTKITNPKLLRIADEGVKIVNGAVLTTEDLEQYNIATVLLETSKTDPHRYIPIVIPHENSQLGITLRDTINTIVESELGASPLEKIGTSDYARAIERKAERGQLFENVVQSGTKVLKWAAVLSIIGGTGTWGVNRLSSAIHNRQEAKYEQSVKSLPNWELKINNVESLATRKARLEALDDLMMCSCGDHLATDDFDNTLNRNNPDVQLKSIELTGKIIRIEFSKEKSFWSNGPNRGTYALWNDINDLVLKSPSQSVRFAAANESLSIYETAKKYEWAQSGHLENFRKIAVHSKDPEIQRMFVPYVK